MPESGLEMREKRAGVGEERRVGQVEHGATGRGPAIGRRGLPAMIRERCDDAPDGAVRTSPASVARCVPDARLYTGPSSLDASPEVVRRGPGPPPRLELREANSDERVLPLVNNGGDSVGAAACTMNERGGAHLAAHALDLI